MSTFPIIPCAKPRMTKRDKWKKRPIVLKYFAFRDEVRASGMCISEGNTHITFVIPMPKSWSIKKRTEMLGKPHQQRPDKDNLEKGLLDAIFDEDCRVWRSMSTKVWGVYGAIITEAIRFHD